MVRLNFRMDNAYVERFIGTVRRECPDHQIIFNESSLKRILKSYFEYYEDSRTRLSLEKDPPTSRAVQASESGRVVELPHMSEEQLEACHSFTAVLRGSARHSPLVLTIDYL
jgi:hypothetical protein